MVFIKNKEDSTIIREIVVALMIIFVFFYYHITFNTTFLIAGIGLLSFVAIFFNYWSSFLIGIILVPHIMMIKVAESPEAILGYFFLIFQLKYFFSKGLKVNSFGWACLISYIFSICMSAVVTGQASLIISSIKSIVYIVFLSSIISRGFNNSMGRQALIAYIIGCITCVFTAAYDTLLNGGDIVSGYFSAVDNDRNFYGVSIVCGVASCIALSFNLHDKIPALVLAVILSVGGILSGSRTFFLSLITVWLLLLYQSRQSEKKSRILSILVIILLGLTFLAYLPYFLPTLDNIVLSRFDQDDVAGGNGRLDSWIFYLNEWKQTIASIFFGIGNSTKYVVAGQYDVVEHNTYVQMLCTYGIIGMVSIGMSYIWILKLGLKKCNTSLISYIPLIVFLFGYSTINGMHGTAFDTCFFLSIVMIMYINKFS